MLKMMLEIFDCILYEFGRDTNLAGVIVKWSEFHSSSYVVLYKEIEVGFLFAIMGLHIKSLKGN